ncbi:MAG: FAD-dependent oxidoreductase, partial [Planctomycetota bacterium]
MITLKINNQEIKSTENTSILKASLDAGIYIPHLCSHPDLKPIADSDLQPYDVIYQANNLIKSIRAGNQTLNGCQLCLVEIKGTTELQRACATTIKPDMEISTDTERIRQARQDNLAKILAEHSHSCLTCAQSEGCSLTQCSSNVPQNERCCPKFGRCELQKVSQYIGIPLSTPRYIPQNIPVIENDPQGHPVGEPLFKRNYNLCIGCLRCVRACRNLRGIDALGFVINDGKVIVGSKQPTLKDSACKFCGACVEVCPTGAILDNVLIGADRVKSLVPCKGNCPVGMDAPSYIRSIKENHLDEAFEVIQHKVPFPSVLGRVCFHPCEENCRRKELNEPISICSLKRYATEYETTDKHRWTQKIDNNKIAVIGGGPSGLSAAYYLAQKGYTVSIFEANNEPGGMMRYAIPEYRLPLSVLSTDLKKIITHKNITIKTNSTLGKDFFIESLKKEGYKAILIAIGAQLPKKVLQNEIRNLQSAIYWGIDFLKDIRNNRIKQDSFKDKSVLVIGGGNVAIDVALSAKRLDAKNIQLVCLESRETMPAHKWEI